MSIQIELKPEIEAELTARAHRTGVPISQYVPHILEQYLPVRPVETGMSAAAEG